MKYLILSSKNLVFGEYTMKNIKKVAATTGVKKAVAKPKRKSSSKLATAKSLKKVTLVSKKNAKNIKKTKDIKVAKTLKSVKNIIKVKPSALVEKIATPYYLMDEKKLLRNMQIIERIQQISGAKCLLALKCFATWSTFPLMRKYMSGTTSSSLYEAKLGYETFGGETHAYCVGYSRSDIQAVAKFADKVIFNSLSQLDMYYDLVKHLPVGLRINPGISNSSFDLANPARRFSRLGVVDKHELTEEYLKKVHGIMLHYNCENDSFEDFETKLEHLSEIYGHIFERMDWISLGGGLYFGKDDYPVDDFAECLRKFARKFKTQVYLEPGESSITFAGELVTSVVDIVHNEKDIAIVDASIEAHALDLLIYDLDAKMKLPANAKKNYIVAGRSCLAGDVFGEYHFPRELQIGDEIRFADSAGYTMVKKNWFNGLQMPSIAIKRLNGKVELIKKFSYKDFKNSLS